jgi:hypothetical protein
MNCRKFLLEKAPCYRTLKNHVKFSLSYIAHSSMICLLSFSELLKKSHLMAKPLSGNAGVGDGAA